MKEATGELNMTVITIVAIAVIGGILALMWDPITEWIRDSFGAGAGAAQDNLPNGVNPGIDPDPLGP